MGPWTIAALLGILAINSESGRSYAKKLVKNTIIAGYRAKELSEEFVEKAKEYKDDLVAEVKEESREHHPNGRVAKKKSKVSDS